MVVLTVLRSRARRALARVPADLTLSALVLLLFSAARLLADAPGENWRLVRRHEGIDSFQADHLQRPLSAFRARMVLEADMWTALAILDDVDRACEWTSHCAEMRRLRATSSEEFLVYARMDAPWPVRDRDVVVRVRVSYGELDELLVSITAAREEQDNAAPSVVRMPRFDAHYRFRALAAERTEVEYQIDLDPGGTLPDWLKQMIARDLSHDTLADLRRRTHWARERGVYGERRRALSASARAQGFRAQL
jgi:START domain